MASEVKIKVKAKDETKPEVEKAKRNVKEMEKSISLDFKKMRTNITDAVKWMSKWGAKIASIGSLVGPAVSGTLALAKGVVAVAHALVTMAPAVAILPSLAAGVGLVVGTIKMAGPAMIKSLSPIGDAFKRIQGEVGNLASKGLGPLASQFVKVNFPAIHKAMDSIATSMNHVVASSIAWVNTGQGQHMIAGITASTADAMKSLEGPLSRVVMSFGNMVNRVGGGFIQSLANGIGRAADATARWMNSVDKNTVAAAFQEMAAVLPRVRQGFEFFKDVGSWMVDNQQKVKDFSNVLAGAGLALGIATGNIPAILASSFSLVTNNWEQVKSIFTGAVSFFSGIWNGIKNDPSIQSLFASAKQAWQNFVDGFGQNSASIKENFDSLVGNLKKAWDQWGPVISAWVSNIVVPAFETLGVMLGSALSIFLSISSGIAAALAFMGGVFRWFVGVALDVLGTLVNGAARAFSWIPGVGPKLAAAAADFNAFRDRVNASLAGIRDEHVTITVEEVRRTTTVNVTPQSLMHGLRTGGVMGAGHAAGGGPRSGMTWVGENGPELVRLPAGSMVRTASASRAMVGNTGGGDRLVFVSGGTQIDDLLVQILRKAVVRRGGNVQEVLGVT